MRALNTIHANIKTFELYLGVCVARRDWHGVRDAATDIEKLEVELRISTDALTGGYNAALEG